MKELTPKQSETFVRTWMTKIEDALKREKTFRRQGKECVTLYEGDKADETPFAILYSNTETLIPAVYSQPPVPIVDRRFKDADPVGKLAAEAGTRTLKFLLDASSEDDDSFDECLQADVLGGLVTNRGLSRAKYYADTSSGTVQNECVYFESVRWDKFLHGYARTWKKVPWIGFEWDMDRKEIEDNFGGEIANKIDFDAMPESWGNEEDPKENNSDKMAGVKITKVYEVWDKASRQVMFFCPAYKLGPLKRLEDPLKLSGFFPVPRPLNFMRKVSTLLPTPLYTQYQQQAKELNEITRRLKHLIQAMKIRGFYNSMVQGIDKVLMAEENEIVPLQNAAAVGDNAKMDAMIWLMPVAEIAAAIQQLYQQREQCKNVIYEITGISDIIRGSSVASETATAQNIKNQWGTLRLKRMQREVQRYCRDLMAIALEIAVERFSVETMSAMTGLPYPTNAQKQQVQMQIMAGQQMLQQAQMQAQQTGQQPPEIPPEVQQQLQQAQELLAKPSWEDVLGLLKNDVQRAYRIDIETNSTIDASASEDKQDISDLLNALSQFMNGIAPLVQEGVMPADVAKEMLLAVCRRYTFGPQLEDALMKMQAPQPKTDPADEAKLKIAQTQAQVAEAEANARMAEIQMEMKAKEQEHAMKMQEMAAEMQLAQEEMAMKRSQIALDNASANMKLEQQQKAHTLKMSSMEESHNLTMEQKRQQAAASKKKEPA
jgi:type II secretory pathway pseudopilin PulG